MKLRCVLTSFNRIIGDISCPLLLKTEGGFHRSKKNEEKGVLEKGLVETPFLIGDPRALPRTSPRFAGIKKFQIQSALPCKQLKDLVRGSALLPKRDERDLTQKRVATQFFRATSTLPKKATRFTVLRSPHIDKKSREQFEFVQHRSTITLTYSSATHFFVWLQLQQNPGFQCKVVVTYTTRLLKNKTS